MTPTSTPTPTAPEIGAGLMDLEPAMVTQIREAISGDWGINRQRFITNGTVMRDETGNDWFFSQPAVEAEWKRRRELILAALDAAAPVPLGCEPVVRENERLREALATARNSGSTSVTVQTADLLALLAANSAAVCAAGVDPLAAKRQARFMDISGGAK